MRGAVIPTSVYKGIPTTFTLRRGCTVPRFFYDKALSELYGI